MGGAAAGVDVRAVGRRVDHVDGGAQRPQRRGRGAEGRAVAAVDHHVQTVELPPLERVDQRGHVVVECAAVLARHADAHALGPGLRLR